MSGSGVLLRLPDAEWRMRRGFPVEIVEARAESLASLAEWLARQGYAPERRRVGDLGRKATAACVRLVEVTAEESAVRLAELTRRGAGETVAVAAMVAENDETSLSKALAVGPDDLLTYPFDEEELEIRLDALQQLGRARAVLAERARTFARFMPVGGNAGATPASPRAASAGLAPTMAPAPSPTTASATTPSAGLAAGPRAPKAGARSSHRPAGTDRPRVLVVGPASHHKVKVGEALARATINYADNLEKAKGPLEAGGFEMVVLLGTNPAARRDLLRWPELAGPGCPATLLVLDAASSDDQLELRQRLAQLPVADRLSLPQPAELVRARMDFWLGVVRLQRQLSGPATDRLDGLCQDGLTGLFNHGFFLEHLRHLELDQTHRRALVIIELVNLPRLNESAGHAAVNRYLATLGPSLRLDLRAEDLAAHLGGGRFAVLLDDVAPAAATRIGRRLEHLLTRLPEAARQLGQAATVTPRLTASSLELDQATPPLQQLQERLRWRRLQKDAASAA